MALQSNVNSMKIEKKDEQIKYLREAILCITIATVIGLIVYQIFLYFKIAIFGWNLGLIFAPLIAGYTETILARKMIGESIGAISAFILFAYTTFYSFILKNTALGLNIITIVSIIVILQAAFPTLINYLIIRIGLGTLLYLIGIFKKITGYIYNKIKSFIYKYILKKPVKPKIIEKYEFDEMKSNETINSLNFYFITSTDVLDKNVTNLGQFNSTAIVEKATIKTPPEHDEFEQETLYKLKKGKDECLIKLVNKIKAAGGNGIIGLDIQYSSIGISGDNYQVTALGMGIYLK